MEKKNEKIDVFHDVNRKMIMTNHEIGRDGAWFTVG